MGTIVTDLTPVKSEMPVLYTVIVYDNRFINLDTVQARRGP